MNTNEIAMNIYSSQTNVNPGSRHTERVSDKADASSASVKASTPESSSDTVTLTRTAGEVQKLEAQLASFPDVDNQRVADIKAAIDNGSYQVDTGKIVDKLLDMEQALNHV